FLYTSKYRHWKVVMYLCFQDDRRAVTLNDISKPGPDKPLRISAFGRFWWVKSRKLWPGVKARQGRGSFHIIGAASPLFTALQVFSNGEKRSTTRVIIDVAVFDQIALHIAHAVMIQSNPETTACQ